MKFRIPFTKFKEPEIYANGSPWRACVRKLLNNKAAAFSLMFLIVMFICCIFADKISPYDYTQVDKTLLRAKPSFDHIFGCDYYGRDLFTRVMMGGRVSLKVGVGSMLMAGAFGTVVGLVSGYFGGRTDMFIMRVMDVLASIPSALLAVTTLGIMGMKAGNIIYAIAISSVPAFTRLVRASVLSIMDKKYIEAARALGVKNAVIIRRHVLRNVLAPIIIYFMTGVAEALMVCSALGYLGLGINPPAAEWGDLVYEGRMYFRACPHLIMFPGGALVLTILAFNLLGDGLQEALDPRVKEE